MICANCGNRIAEMEGVGWIHEAGALCDEAEPAESERNTDPR